MMQESLTIDAAAVLGHFRALAAFGASRASLEETLGFSEKDLEVIDTRVPFLNNLKMIEKGVALLGADVPLRLGTQITLERLGVCGHIFRNCENVAEVVDQFVRYQRILYAVSDFKTSGSGNTFRIEHSIKIPTYNSYNRMTVELAFSSIVTVLRELVQEDLTPLEIRFSYPKPDDLEIYQKILCSPLRFHQDKDVMVFRREDLKTVIPRSQSYIKEIMAQHADGLMRELEEWTGFKNEVMKLAIENLPKGTVDIEMIAGRLNMSRWTLTRKLKKEGLTFQALMNGLKKDIALNYLENNNLSITEIAFLLGYSEVSAFRRAFKSWTGRSPTHFR